MRRQPGQVLAFFALVLPIVLIPLVAYAVDAAALGTRAAGLQAAAAQAAEVAAQQIDASALRASGLLQVDAADARELAGEILKSEAPGALLDDVLLAGADVTVVAHETVELPIPWFEKQVTLRAREMARLAAGYDSPSSRLPLPASTF